MGPTQGHICEVPRCPWGARGRQACGPFLGRPSWASTLSPALHPGAGPVHTTSSWKPPWLFLAASECCKVDGVSGARARRQAGLGPLSRQSPGPERVAFAQPAPKFLAQEPTPLSVLLYRTGLGTGLTPESLDQRLGAGSGHTGAGGRQADRSWGSGPLSRHRPRAQQGPGRPRCEAVP